MSATSAPAPPPVWVSAAVAATVMQTHYRRVRALVAAGRIRTYQVEGGNVRLALEDVQRLAAEAQGRPTPAA